MTPLSHEEWSEKCETYITAEVPEPSCLKVRIRVDFKAYAKHRLL